MGNASRQGCGRSGVASLGMGKLLAAAVALCLCMAGAMAAQGLSAQRAFGAELTDAQVQQRIEAGSLGFFKSLGAKGEKAVEVLENPASKVAGWTDMGADGDATSMYNLWRSVGYMDECNDLRDYEGTDPKTGDKLGTLKVDPELMAIAEVQLNWSRDNAEVGHSDAYSVGENLSWNYSDPFDGWYYEEKADYDAGITDFRKVGHYLNIATAGHGTTGFAVAEPTEGPYSIAHGQTFGSSSENEADLMTVVEFRAALQNYLPVEYLPASVDIAWDGSNYYLYACLADGTPVSGWLDDGYGWYFADDEGRLQSGWVHDGTGWYWMGDDYAMTTGWQRVGGTWYYLDSSNGGRMATGWKSIGGTWYYFDPDSGAMQTGWYKVDGEWNWSDSSGAWHPNSWETSGDRWWYSWADGTYPTSSWQLIGGKWYHFDGSGYMQTGWLDLGGTWYYLNGGGDMATGWKLVNGAWYYLNSGGDMATGWKLVGGKWYYLNGGGDMATGWKSVDGTWYFLNSDGSMAANEWAGNYWLGASGAMATNGWVDGGKYYVGADGAWVPNYGQAPKDENVGSDQPVTTAYVGNSSTMKFHVAGCPDEKKIAAENRVALADRAAAVAQGYSPCGHCKPVG